MQKLATITTPFDTNWSNSVGRAFFTVEDQNQVQVYRKAKISSLRYNRLTGTVEVDVTAGSGKHTSKQYLKVAVPSEEQATNLFRYLTNADIKKNES